MYICIHIYIQAIIKCDNANDYALALFAVMLLGNTNLERSGGVRIIVVFHNEVCPLLLTQGHSPGGV
jgi:hypothetical protein